MNTHNILAIDTSGPVCSVAVLSGASLRYEARALNKLTHSRNLMPMVDEALAKAGVEVTEISHIAAVVGPGSFTGVRIGVAAAQGISRGLNIPCIAVDALEAMAGSLSHVDAVVCPIRDARSNQVYGAAFKGDNRLMPDEAMKLDAYLQQVSAMGDWLFFIGDGAVAYQEDIQAILGARAVIAPPHLIQPGAAAAAVLAARRLDQAVQPDQLMPLYLRAPQAVRLRAQKEQRG